MIKLDKYQKIITKNLSNKKIKSVNDFCVNLFDTVILKPNENNDQKYTKIMIYSDRGYAFKLAQTFRHLINGYIEDKYLIEKPNTSLPIFKPFWDYETRYCHKNMTIFYELKESCEIYSQKIFIINKPIRLKILALFAICLESKDFKIIISQIFKLLKIIFLFLRKHIKLAIIIGILGLTLQILRWIYPNYLDFFKIIKKIFY